MKPVYEMTYDEWKGLSTLEKSKYQPVFNVFPSNDNNNYYYYVLKEHVVNGGTITKRIWDNLPPNWQSHLINAYTYK